MAIAVWNDRFATGIPLIDDQHKGLFDAINGLHDAIRAGRAKAEIARLLEFLERYTATHFRDEEAFMARQAFPGLDAHKEEHARLLARVKELKAKVADGHPGSVMEVATFLADWLKHHINERDFIYVAHARANGHAAHP